MSETASLMSATAGRMSETGSPTTGSGSLTSATGSATPATLGCDTGQGYFISRPLPAAELTQILRTAPPAAKARRSRVPAHAFG